MTTYKELLQQREALELKIQNARKTELAEAVAKVRTLVQEFNLTSDDVFGKGKGKANAKQNAGTSAKVAPKYRNPETGETWTGRGKAPTWIRDKDRMAFAI